MIETTPRKPVPVPARAAAKVTLRSIVIGVLLMPLNSLWITQMADVRYAAHPTTISLFFNAVFILLVLIGINSLIRWRWPNRGLSRVELLTIYIMICIASALCGHDMIQVLTPQIITPYRFATPENQWRSLFFQYLPNWLLVKDPTALNNAFAGGSSIWQPQNWRPWIGPLCWWTSFIIALIVMWLCLNSLLRRRWTEDEKLTYPITHLPLELTSPETDIFRNKLMWIGFGIAAFIDIVNGFHELYPYLPYFRIRVVHFDPMMQTLFTERPWTALAGTRVSLYPFAIGLGMLLPLDLLFSCWFFYLLSKVQLLTGMMTGWNQIPRFPFLPQQAFGAYIAIAVFALWVARRYLRDVVVAAIRNRPEDNVGEALSYRAALIGFGASLIYLLWYVHRMGLTLLPAVVFFVIYIGISLAVTKIRAELGPPAHDLHHSGPDQFLGAFCGTGAASPLGARNQTVLHMLFWFNRAYRAHPMPVELEGMKMGQILGIEQRRLWIAMLVAGVVGTLTAFYAQLHCFYIYGISAKMSFVSTVFGREPFNELQSWLAVPQPRDINALLAMVFGFIVTLTLNALRMRFMWFPFHPVGYATATSWSMNVLWVPLLIAYMVKLGLVRYGGYSLFRRAIPFAIGLILGEFVIGSLWQIYGIVFNVPTYGFWV